MPAPDPDRLLAIPGFSNTVFLRPLLAAHPEIGDVEVGDYSYYSDLDDPTRFFDRNVRYNFGFSGARLVIGRYCAIAHGATFVMADADHVTDGISTFPFPVFGGVWAEALPPERMPFPNKGDIVLGHDVWCAMESLILPGVRVGTGAVIAARAVVSRDVPDYAVVAGNPARVVKSRFAPDVVARLLALAWWDWPVEAVGRAVPLLVRGDVAALENFASSQCLQPRRTP